MTLPLSPPVPPQLARSKSALPEGDEWRYEPKYDGFRTVVFRDGDDVHLQSRNGKPMNRYFPEVVEQVLASSAERVVFDGELIVVIDGVQEFDLLSQRIHPAKSRVEMLAEKYPAAFVAFDLLAEDDEELLGLSYTERRERLEKVVSDPDPALAHDRRPRGRRPVADRQLGGRGGQAGGLGLPARRAQGDGEDQAPAHARTASWPRSASARSPRRSAR